MCIRDRLKVTPSQGKTMAADDPKLTALKAYPRIKIYTETLEDHALVICGEHQAMVTIKGVDDNFAQMADLNKLLYGDGTFTLHADVLEFGVLGIQLAAQLGLGASFDTPLRAVSYTHLDVYKRQRSDCCIAGTKSNIDFIV